MGMNGKQRILAALNHQTPDRIPIDFGGLQSGIHIRAYRNLLKLLKIDEEIVFNDVIQHTVKPSEEVLDYFDVDVRYLYPKRSLIPLGAELQLSEDGKYQGIHDQFGVFWGEKADKKAKEILYLDPSIHPLAKCKTSADVHSYNWPDGKDKTPFEGLKQDAEKLRKTGCAISSVPMANTYEYTNFLFGFSRSLILLRKNPEVIIAAIEELTKYWKDHVKTFYECIDGNVDIICVNGDLAEQAGPIMNPRIYRKYIKPFDKEISDFVHGLGDVKINYHSCGSVFDFIPDFIDIGYDAINPVQLGAYNMESNILKSKFGDKIAFWGGLCNTEILAFGSPEDVKREVNKNIESLGKNGGYVAANIHNITAEVPPENIDAIFKTVIKKD